METHQLSIAKTAKVCTLGDVTTASHVWIVLHGYGQLAQYFIRHFRGLVNDHTAVIAPEAMARFYTEGFSGRVGASWMTKEERETDIADYLQYLQQVHDHFQLTGKKVILLGFSQGGATAARWFAAQPDLFAHLVLWCSVFPPDFDLPTILTKWEEAKCHLVAGINDPFRSKHEFEMMDAWKAAFPSLHVTTFEGGHEIPEEPLLALEAALRR